MLPNRGILLNCACSIIMCVKCANVLGGFVILVLVGTHV